MIRAVIGILFVLALVLHLCPADTWSQSVYGMNFIGEHNYHGSIRYRALGLSSFASPDSNNAATANIAALADIDAFTLSFVQILSTSNINTETESAARNRYQIPELSFAVPLRRGIVLATGYRMRFQAYMDFEYERTYPDIPSTFEEHRQRGSLFTVPISLAWKITPWLNVAGELQLERGSLSNEVSINFRKLGYGNVESKRERFFNGVSWSASILLKVHPRIFIAAAFDDQIDYQVDEKFTYSRPDLNSATEWDYNLPISYSGAISLGISKRWWLSSHYWFREAPDPTGFPQLEGSLRDERLLAFGIERTGSGEGGFFSRTPIRLGFYENIWHLEYPIGQQVKGLFFTFGTGFSMPGGPGIFDISFEFGQIGSIDDNGLVERMMRIGVGMSLSEIWGRRKDKRH